MCAALLDLLTSTSKWNDTLPALESLCAAQGRPHDLLLEIVRGGGSGGVDLSALKEEAEVRLRAQRTIKTKSLSTYVSLFPDVLEVSDMRHGRVSVRCAHCQPPAACHTPPAWLHPHHHSLHPQIRPVLLL